MGKIFCVEFQRVPLKFNTKYPTHTMMQILFKVKIWELTSVFETPSCTCNHLLFLLLLAPYEGRCGPQWASQGSDCKMIDLHNKRWLLCRMLARKGRNGTVNLTTRLLAEKTQLEDIWDYWEKKKHNYIKMHVSWQEFPKLASDWLANQKPGLKILVH